MGSMFSFSASSHHGEANETVQNYQRPANRPLPLSDEFSFVPTENRIVDLRDEFENVEKLGRGNTSSVWLMRQNATDQLYAVKKMPRSRSSNAGSFQREAKTLLKINHDHVVRLTGLYVDRTHYYITQECCAGGTVYDRLGSTGFSEEDAIDISYQILDAVKFLHDHDIVHRDIKLTNILFKTLETNHIVLVDFGMAMEIQDSDEFKDWVGTPLYMAPEVTCKRTGADLKKCDIWAVGITIFLLMTRHMPFFGRNQKELLQEICQRKLTFPKEPKVSPTARKFIASLLRRSIPNRLSADEAIQHEWLEPARIRASKVNDGKDDDSDEKSGEMEDIPRDCMDEATISLMDDDDGFVYEEEYVQLIRNRRMIADRAKLQGLEDNDGKRIGDVNEMRDDFVVNDW